MKTTDIPFDKSSTFTFAIIVFALVAVVCLLFSLDATNRNVESLRVKNLLQFGMTETQANYYWGSTPVVVKSKAGMLDIPSNVIPKGGKLVLYRKGESYYNYLVHFSEEGKIDFLHFWLS